MKYLVLLCSLLYGMHNLVAAQLPKGQACQAHQQIKIIDEELNNALWQAILNNQTQDVEGLLSNATIPDVNAIESGHNKTALMFAAMYNRDAIIKILIRYGALINKSNTAGVTPLMIASLFGAFDVAKTLLEHGANINAIGNSGNTALHYACMEPYNFELFNDQGQEKIVKLLISKNVPLNTQNKSKNTALMLALYREYANKAIVRLLIKAGADTTLKNSQEKTVLDLAPDDRLKMLISEKEAGTLQEEEPYTCNIM